MGSRHPRQVEEREDEIDQSNEESFKAALWLKVLKYDFNFDHDDLASTIQSTFTVDNTNDLGERIIPHTAHIIEMEFRRFMYLNFLSILIPNKKAKFEKEYCEKQKKTYYTTAYFPGPYVDRFWKLIIVHDDCYDRFCEEFVGGYIHRDFDSSLAIQREKAELGPEEFRDDIEQVPLPFKIDEHDAYTRYKLTRKHIMQYEPFRNLWPKYPSQRCFLTDYKYEVVLRTQVISDVITHIDRAHVAEPNLINQGNFMASLVKMTSQIKDTFNIEAQETTFLNKLKEKTNDHKLANHAHSAFRQFNDLIAHKLPYTFTEVLMDRFMIEGVTASRWILEYLKFICLSTLSKSELFPSDIVDRVWHMHMIYTTNYRDMINSIKGIIPDHTQECCHKVDDGDQKEVYEDTLSFYEAIFQDPPPADIWLDPEEEFSNEKSKLINVNLYRLTHMHYVKNTNGLFLNLPGNNMNSHEFSFQVNQLYTPNSKRFVLRRIRRRRVPYKEDPLNWRRNYKVNNRYKAAREKILEVPNFDIDRKNKKREGKAEGSDIFVCGGLAIYRNSFHEASITNTNYGTHIYQGFPEDIKTCTFDYNLDDIADCAWGGNDVLLMVPEMLKTLKFLNVRNIKTDLLRSQNMLVLKRSELKIDPDEYYEEFDTDEEDSNMVNSQGPLFDEEEEGK